MLLIPAIDLRGGRCVRLYQGNFGSETRYDYEPRELLERYQALGASWIHVVDLDGAKDGVLANRDTVTALASAGIAGVQVGGGVRSISVVEDLLAHGISRVVVGSAAIERPEEVTRWIEAFGPDRICVAFDVRLDAQGRPRVRTHGWTEGTAVTLWEAIARFPAGLLRHVLCTDIERDGALTGPNVELYREGMARFAHLDWQASGGIRNAADLAALAQIGVAAAVSGKALLENRITSEELRPFLPDASSPASMSATARL